MIIAILMGCFIIYEIICLIQYKQIRKEEEREKESFYRIKPRR